MRADPLNDTSARFKTLFASIVDVSAAFVGADEVQFKAALKALADSKDPAEFLLTSTDSAMVPLRERTFVSAGLYDDQIKQMVQDHFLGKGAPPLRRLADRDPSLAPVIIRRDGSKLER